MSKFINVSMTTAMPYQLQETIGEYKKGTAGYTIADDKGNNSWVSKEKYEANHLPITRNSSVTEEDVENMIGSILIETINEKTTFVQVTLLNGFTLEETSSCVDPKNYDMEMGADICMTKIKDKIWFLLDFLLCSAKDGFNYFDEDAADE